MESNATRYDTALQVITYVSLLFRNYVIIVIIVFGIIGNLLSMIVFALRRHVDKVSATYLGPLALYDLGNIGVATHFWLISGAIKSDGYIGSKHHSETDWGCKMLVYFHQYVIFLSGWTIVLFSLERALVIHFPFKMAAILNGRFRRNILLSMAVIGVIVNGLSLTAVPSLRQGVNFCRPADYFPEYAFITYYFVIIGVNMLIPCTLLLFLNIWIVIGVIKPDQKIEKHSTANSSWNKEKRLLKNLIAVSSCYFIFVSPIAIFAAIGLATNVGVTSPIVAELTNFSFNWMVLNSAVNCILYTFSLPYYRRFVLNLFLCRKGDDTGTGKSEK